MKGALACYVEAVRALADAALRAATCMIAAVAGEIEKTQQGDAQGAEYRGYAAGSRYLVGHGGAADMCILGEPTEQKLVLGALRRALAAALDARAVHPHGVLVRAARGELDRAHARRARPRARVAAGVGGGDDATATCAGSRTSARSRAASAGASRGRRTGPTSSSTCACRRTWRWRRRAGEALEFARGARRRRGRGVRDRARRRDRGGAPARRRRSTEAHEEVFGAAPERDVTRWFSDASVLTRYGIATVNYGTSTRPARPGARREPRDRRAGEDGRGLCARGDGGLRGGGVKLVTFDERAGRAGRRRGDRRARRADHARVVRARRRGRDRRARAARGRAAARADRAEEVLPHGRQLPRARGGVEARRLVARDRAVDRLLPERRRDRRAGRAGRLSRAPDRGARLRARAGGRAEEGRASGSRPRRRWTTSAAT